MRKDMGKVITERPRTGSRYKKDDKGYKKLLQKEGLDHVRQEKIKMRGGNERNFTDVIGPLAGFLEKNVGRPWDKVLSEINQSLPATGGVSYIHARDHLFQLVETKTRLIEGELCDSKGLPIRGWVRFFVCPKGFLRKRKRERYKWQNTAPTFTKTEAGEWIIQDMQGIWYACQMKELKEVCKVPCDNPHLSIRGIKRSVHEMVYDVMRKEQTSDPWVLKKWYGSAVYAAVKRQLNKREIKHYQLREAG
jgi:hypothetical protein